MMSTHATVLFILLLLKLALSPRAMKRFLYKRHIPPRAPVLDVDQWQQMDYSFVVSAYPVDWKLL